MKKAFFVFAIFLLLTLPVAFAAQGVHVIKGRIFTPENRPAPRIEVVLENSTGRQLEGTFADQDGRYVFAGLGFGTYRIVIPDFGHNYKRAWQDVEISGSQNSIIVRTVDFRLQINREGSAKLPPGTVSAFNQDVPEQAQQEYAKADEELQKGPSDEGIQHLKRAIEMFPDYYIALTRLGTEYAKAGQYEMAIEPLRRASKVNPHSMASQGVLGMALVEVGKFEEAIPVLMKCKSLDSKSLNTHLYLGIAQMQVSDYAGSEQNLKRAYELGGARVAIVQLHLASIYDQQGKYGQSADALEAYLKDVPNAKNADKIKEVIKRLRKKKD